MKEKSIATLVQAWRVVDFRLADCEAEHKRVTNPLKAAMLRLEGMIADQMDAVGANSMRTDYGTPTFAITESMKVVDRESFFAWVLDNRATDVLTSAVSKDAIRERGIIPPGVEMARIRKLHIRGKT